MRCTNKIYVLHGLVICSARTIYMCGSDELCAARMSCMCGTDKLYVRHGWAYAWHG